MLNDDHNPSPHIIQIFFAVRTRTTYFEMHKNN